MKKYTLLLLLFCSVATFAQRDTIFFYANQDLKQVAKADAKIIIKMFQRDEKWIVATFNANLVIQQEETYLDSLLTIKTGPYQEYTDGKVSLSGLYNNNKKDGKFITYTSAGKVREMSIYRLDTLKSKSYYYSGGAKREERIYENGIMVTSTTFRGDDEAKSEVLTYDSPNQIKSRLVYYPDGKTVAINETFSKGKLNKGEYFDLAGNPTKKFQMEELPAYPDGMERFYEFINRNLNYPSDVVGSGTQTVHVSFTVTETGALEDFKIERAASNPILDREAIRVLKLSKNWIPGKQFGKPVKVKFNIPIKFESR